MDYKKIITDVATTLDPDLSINVDLASVEDIVDAHFIVADINYPTRDMRIPFIIFNDGTVFYPFDWESVLPITSDNIYTTKWVRFDSF